MHADLLGQHRLEQLRIEVGGQVDAFLALALAAAEVGQHQPFMLHQRIGLGEQRRAAVGQAVFGAARAALLGHPIRVGERQQGAEPARVLDIAHRRGYGGTLEIALELPGQLARPLHPALGGTRGPALAAEQGDAAVQVGTLAAA
ncbi:hypothetical protein D3C86_1414310 [compost metagenome]